MKTFTILAISVMAASLISFAQAQESIDKEAIGPFKRYCDGYGRPGAKGIGYVSVLKVSTGVVDKTDDTLLDSIVAYDRAEANDAYIGQINMLTASSFSGLAGQIWGYDIAVSEKIKDNKQQPLFTIKQYDGSDLKVYDGAPLLEAGKALFGTEQERRFPPAPGAHVICANKSVTSYRPKTGEPDTSKNEAYGVWSYIVINIAKDRNKDASLFIEDAGLWTKNANEKDLNSFLEEHRKSVLWSVVACGKDQSVIYDRSYISYAYVIMKPGQIGTALTVAPYIVLAKDAVPREGFGKLNEMTLKEWEKSVGFK